MISVNVQIDPIYEGLIDPDHLQNVVSQSLRHCEVEMGELTLVVTTDEAMRTLNHQYRGLDAPTDVLSFATQTETETQLSSEGQSPPDQVAFIDGMENVPGISTPLPYLGDIIIAAPTAARQAQAAGHQPSEEILLLAIHGLLHLLGYDHLQPSQQRVMWQKQRTLLQLHGLGHVKPTKKS